MHLGIALPFGDIGGDGPIVREFAQLAETEGYEGALVTAMSAFTPIATKLRTSREVRFVPSPEVS